MQNLGLQELYNDADDRSLKSAVHSLLAIAFLPPAQVLDAFDQLERESPQAAHPVFCYFHESYLRGPQGRGRRRGPRVPRYAVELWNTYEATVADEHRTNNISEGWHNRFQVGVGGCEQVRGVQE